LQHQARKFDKGIDKNLTESERRKRDKKEAGKNIIQAYISKLENWNQGVKDSSAVSVAWVLCRSHSAVLLFSEKPLIILPATCVLF